MSLLKLKDRNGNPIISSTIIGDERNNGSKANENGSAKQFKDMNKKQIRKAVKKIIDKGSIQDIINSDGMDITVHDLPEECTKQPVFHHGQGGDRDMVHPGNDQFVGGEKIPRPPGGGGGGSGEGDASDSGEGEDEFTFTLTKDEYLDLLFEDLELPYLQKKDLVAIDEWIKKRNGFSNDGSPENMDIRRTKQKNMARNIAMGASLMKMTLDLCNKTVTMLNAKTNKDADLAELKGAAEIVLAALDVKMSEYPEDILEMKRQKEYFVLCEEIITTCRLAVEAKRLGKDKVASLLSDILAQHEKLQAMYATTKPVVAMDESIDGKFRAFADKPVPSNNAVMFCLMDVSGSMSQETKDMAKRFYIMLYLFLVRSYNNVEIVYIRHHTQAKEVDEEEFFYGKETGGTIVSSALELMNEIQQSRFPASQWNIYAAQASDGDNWSDDSPKSGELVRGALKSYLRYFMYIEITERRHQSLWREYQSIANEDVGLFMGHIQSVSDIYPVFRDAFTKKQTER